MNPKKLQKVLKGVAKADMDDLFHIMNAIVERRKILRKAGEDD